MKKQHYIFCSILLFAFTQSVLAQTKLDSLKQQLAEVTSDSIRIRILVDLCTELQYENIDEAQQYTAEALAISEKKNWNWGLAESNVQMAFLATLMGDFTTALKFDNRYLQAVRNMNDSLAIAKALNNIGQDYSDLGEYDDAYYYITRSYKVARSIQDSLMQTICLFNLGHVFKELGQYDIALNHFTISSELSPLRARSGAATIPLNTTKQVVPMLGIPSITSISGWANWPMAWPVGPKCPEVPSLKTAS